MYPVRLLAMMNNQLLTVAQLMTATLCLPATPADILARLGDASGVDWDLLAHHADGHSLTPLLYDTWRQARALELLPLQTRQRMAQAYWDNAARNQNIQIEFVEIQRILTEAGVPHLVLKGWPLVERLYPDPAHRVLYDHDFLVPAEQAERGYQALLAAGFNPLPAKDAWIEKHLPPLWRNNHYQWNGYLFDPDYPRPVELHLRLWEQGWRGLQVGQLSHIWAQAQTRPVAGVSVKLLSDEDTLLHLAMHFAGHLVEREARLNQLLDLARFAHQSSFLDWEYIWAQADQTGIGRFVYASLLLAHKIFGAPLPSDMNWQRLAAVTPPGFRHWLEERGSTDVLTADYRCPQTGEDYRLTFLSARSIRERLGIVRFAVLPPLEQLMVKYQLDHRWLGYLFYPRYVVERMGSYGRSWFDK
jgi:hypothetical protein